MPPLRFKMITLCIVFGTMLGGILIPNVETILGLTGATMGSLICFICPALIYRKIQKNGIIAQLVLCVGLGILLISTFTTLSISARSPSTRVQPPPPHPAPDKNGPLLPDLPELHENPPNKKPVEIEKPDHPPVDVIQPAERDEAEPPQIKGPVDVPEMKKDEEVQLDRPDAGVALPEGEAHRHEPPIPHDEVKVDTRKNNEELEEDKNQPDEEEPVQDREQGGGHPVKVDDKKDEKPEEAVARKEEVDLGGGEVLSNEVLEKNHDVAPLKEAEKLNPVKDPQAGNAAAVANQAAVLQVDKAGKAQDAAGKAPEGEHHHAADEAPAAESKDTADEKMEEGQLDHAVLLQVIKEQQVQQKRLLDQQAKLLAVIEEQHKEIHQKQPAAAESEAEKGNQELEGVEGGAAKPKESGKEEVAGAPQDQNHAQVADNAAEDKVAKVAAAYKEDDNAVPGGESHHQGELGARGVPLGKKRAEDHQPALQNDQVAQLKVEEKSLDKEKEAIENLKNEKIEREIQARVEKAQLEREMKEKLAKEQEEKERKEREEIEKEVQARVQREMERERQEKLAKQQELEKEKEALARAEKERLDKERREELIREQEQEKAAKEKLAQEKAALERVQQELHKADNEILERVLKEKQEEEARERQAQLEQAIEAKNAAQGGEREDGEALKKGGRDLKEKAAAEEDPREGGEDGAVRDEARPQGSHEKVRDQGDTDLRRRRRALGPREAGGPLEDNGVPRGVPGLEPLLELGGSDLHAALEQQLLAGAMVHSRQIKQASEDDGAK